LIIYSLHPFLSAPHFGSKKKRGAIVYVRKKRETPNKNFLDKLFSGLIELRLEKNQ